MSPDTSTYERIEKELARLQGIAVAVRAALKQESLTFDELPKSVESLQADLAEARRQVKVLTETSLMQQLDAAEARVRALEQRDIVARLVACDLREYAQGADDMADDINEWADRLDPPAPPEPKGTGQ